MTCGADVACGAGLECGPVVAGDAARAGGCGVVAAGGWFLSPAGAGEGATWVSAEEGAA